MKVLITGAAGFCASHLISRLRRDESIEIAGLDRVQAEASAPGLDRYFQADICDAGAVGSIVGSVAPDSIFHLAGAGGAGVPASVLCSVNLLGTANVLEAVRGKVPQCRVLVIGSAAEYGAVSDSQLPVREDAPCHPTGAYGISKHAAAMLAIEYARRAGLKVVVVRPFNIIGPGVPPSLVLGALVARLKDALRSEEPQIKVGDFNSERDFIGVSDTVDAYVRLLQAEPWGEVFNICSGKAYSIARLAEMLVANSSRRVRLEFDPDLVPASPVRSIYGSFEKAQRAIDFQPTMELERVLAEVWASEIETAAACA